MNRRLFGQVIAGSLCLSLVLAAIPAARAAEIIQVRSGLRNLARLMQESKDAGQPVRIMYLGGTITKGEPTDRVHFRSLLTAEVRRLFPKVGVVEYNHAIAGTGSWLAAFRTPTDVVQHYLPLALAVVEFAVEDAGVPQARVIAAVDGIVRQIRAAHPYADMLFLYTFARDQLEQFRQTRMPEAIEAQELVAAHYNLPSVNLAQDVATKILSGELRAEEFGKPDGRPSPKGHALYLEAIKPLLAKADAADPSSPREKYPLPKPFADRPLDKARLVSYEDALLEPGWRVGQPSPVEERLYTSAVGKFRTVLVCDQPGPAATLRFRGDTVGYFDAVGPDSGDIEFRVDDGAWQAARGFDGASGEGYRPHANVMAENLDPKAEHRVQLRVAANMPAGSKGRTARIGYFLVNGTSVVDDPYKGLTPAARLDKLYSTMGPVQYVPAANRWTFLPQTMARLREGGELRIVMLGDSIINDTASSEYEHLLQRMYPKCKVVKIRSVRGSTGCWWYKEEGRIKPYVLDHRPDLLVIGGISQRDDVDSIRDCIRQVRAAMPSVEVLLVSPVFGTTDPRTDPKWTPTVDPSATGYRSGLARLAAEEKVEFLDMTGPWGEYIRASDKARGWFMRDPVHANARGSQILGRILEKYFAPKG